MSKGFRKHDPSAPADFFAVEAAGLDWLRQAEAVAVPRVISVGRDHIALERIERGQWTRDVDERFGRELADLHRAGADSFGGSGGAYIGPLAMPDQPAASWPAFYAQQRLEPFLAGVPDGARSPIERVIARIDELAGPVEPPARIHATSGEETFWPTRAGLRG